MLVFTNRKVAGTGSAASFSTAFAPARTDLSFANAKAGAKGNWTLKDLGDTADPDFANCWLWVAHYDDAPRAPKIQKTWSKWTLWQYTDGNLGPQPHAINGVGGCDRDTFNGDAAALKAFWTSGGRALPA